MQLLTVFIDLELQQPAEAANMLSQTKEDKQSAESTSCVADSMDDDNSMGSHTGSDLHSSTADGEAAQLDKIEVSAGNVHIKPYQPRNIQFPARVIGNKKRCFRARWFDSYNWLEWDPITESAICHRCKMASKLHLITFSHSREDAFTKTGFKNWKHALDKFKEHQQSATHKEAVLKWSGYLSSCSVGQQISNKKAEELQSRRDILLQLFESLKFLTRQGLATRGHTDSTSNYHQLLHLRAKDSAALRTWLESQNHIKWLSHAVESDMIEQLANSLLRELVQEIRDHEYFSVIVDETTDMSRAEQVSFCIRHVDQELNIFDDFVGMYSTPKTDAATLTSIITDALCRLNLPICCLRGQCYDGASNMAGVHSGVQRRILELQPKAVYVHCTSHSLNLALQDASARVRSIRDALCFTNDLANYFRDSAKRTAVMEKVLLALSENAKKRLLPLCPTRWTVRARALDSVLSNYKPVMESLDELSDEPGSMGAKAAGFLAKMKTFECFSGLKFAHKVFVVTEQLATALQSKQITLTAAKTSAMNVVGTLKEMRSEEYFNTLWLTICEEARELNLSPPVLRRKCKAPRRLDEGDIPYDHPDCAASHRVETWFACLDVVIEQIAERFKQGCFDYIATVEKVLLQAAAGLSVSLELKELEKVYDDFDYDILEAQLIILRSLFKTSVPTTVSDVASVLRSTEGAALMLSEVVRFVKLCLVLPATSASAERSFSALRRLKTYIRSTVGQPRLNHLLLLHCHQDRLDKLDLRRVAQEFISANEKRSNYFGNF
jgi:hypothetical protein